MTSCPWCNGRRSRGDLEDDKGRMWCPYCAASALATRHLTGCGHSLFLDDDKNRAWCERCCRRVLATFPARLQTDEEDERRRDGKVS